jgi:hypothetical protein
MLILLGRPVGTFNAVVYLCVIDFNDRRDDMKTKRTNYTEVIGITENNELYMLTSIFKHSDDLKGATGYVFAPITQDYIDERNDIENVIDTYGYIWTEAVKDGLTTESQEDYMQSFVDNNSEGLYLGHDTSGIYDIPDEVKKEYFPDAENFECIGAGRIFNTNIKWKKIINPLLLKKIIKQEE